MDENHRKKIRRVNEDLYDHLDEPLWSSILSLLPLDEAVRTIVLSRSWKNAWTTIPHLDLDIFNTTQRSIEEEDRDYWVPLNGEDDEWVQTVDKILLSHTGPIQSCRIPTWYSISNLDVDRWIDILIQRSISELVIESSDEFPYQLPTSLFNCTTIEKLVLINCSVLVYLQLCLWVVRI
ncbi:F-box/LRR-repeat protein At3g26922-like [Magnolia sinica]|uniref:F-box/LRR-repeat protein At3g26922-like n=1 Tax=Magnolia sinica TaxID=86752 RepID=UPI002659C979|nr:F-box/LRR-repeat protein At3g26922-like [Magnolia sinica]